YEYGLCHRLPPWCGSVWQTTRSAGSSEPVSPLDPLAADRHMVLEGQAQTAGPSKAGARSLAHAFTKIGMAVQRRSTKPAMLRRMKSTRAVKKPALVKKAAAMAINKVTQTIVLYLVAAMKKS